MAFRVSRGIRVGLVQPFYRARRVLVFHDTLLQLRGIDLGRVHPFRHRTHRIEVSRIGLERFRRLLASTPAFAVGLRDDLTGLGSCNSPTTLATHRTSDYRAGYTRTVCNACKHADERSNPCPTWSPRPSKWGFE
jgi:hypothetical protein